MIFAALPVFTRHERVSVKTSCLGFLIRFSSLKHNSLTYFGYPIFGPLVLLLPNTCIFSIFPYWAVPDEGYCRNMYCTLHLVSTLVLVLNNKADINDKTLHDDLCKKYYIIQIPKRWIYRELELQYFNSNLNNKYRKW